MPSLKNVFQRNRHSTSYLNHDTGLEQFIFNFEIETEEDRARVLLGYECLLYELHERMAHADFKEKRRLSQELEFYEIDYFNLGGKPYKHEKRNVSRIMAKLGLKG